MAKDTTVGMVLHDVARMMRRDFDRRARSAGLSRARWQVLWHLSRHEGIHQAAWMWRRSLWRASWIGWRRKDWCSAVPILGTGVAACCISPTRQRLRWNHCGEKPRKPVSGHWMALLLRTWRHCSGCWKPCAAISVTVIRRRESEVDRGGRQAARFF